MGAVVALVGTFIVLHHIGRRQKERQRNDYLAFIGCLIGGFEDIAEGTD